MPAMSDSLESKMNINKTPKNPFKKHTFKKYDQW